MFVFFHFSFAFCCILYVELNTCET